MYEASREMTFEEEAVLYEQEAREIFAMEDSSDGEGPMVNQILRRGMRVIRKARELIGIDLGNSPDMTVCDLKGEKNNELSV